MSETKTETETETVVAASIDDVLAKLDEQTAALSKRIAATVPPVSATAIDICAIIQAASAPMSIKIQSPRTITTNTYSNERTTDGWIVEISWAGEPDPASPPADPDHAGVETFDWKPASTGTWAEVAS